MKIKNVEIKRQILQTELDGQKTKEARNILGQFSTPFPLACDILAHTKKFYPSDEQVRFLDPAFGTGVFYSALNNAFLNEKIEIATGYEIDEHYGVPSAQLWKDTKLNYNISDFTSQEEPCEDEKYNLVVCNPPYVRHHHIKEKKTTLKDRAFESAGVNLSGLAGLYCYFMAITHSWMKKDGIACWLIPSEFMDVNYGDEIKSYLLNKVSLLQIHRFEPENVQFGDALVSSAVVWFKKIKPNEHHNIKFTYGGEIENPSHEMFVSSDTLRAEKKWSRFPLSDIRNKDDSPRLCDFFTVKRGIATGDNKFFVLTKDEIENMGLPLSQFRPILPSPRYLNVSEIDSDIDGTPDLEQKLFVLDSKLPIDKIKTLYPSLYRYLSIGIDSGVPERYLCRKRKIWYSQEARPESHFYCTYIGRTDENGKKPFRFILNNSKAIVSNSYLILYPKDILQAAIEQDPTIRNKLIDALNNITDKDMLDEGRVYGGGMHKMEPKELSNVNALEIQKILD
ncbi:Eco57I restriction-modification methylase domain-containing protein [Aeromonas caviae]|uniref:Eco57I restriction-modification methylase domain-containing protein n=1 Tax=Aeromonas caviae TaxID=648 RepID=UPI002B4A8660|nr:N-6 DNA methylase [Aeromonas caviae]